ncbi:MAG: serine hydrolase [Deltaproteobacteria bacterium]|nr:serine hydrolase [Deltaproteobacteria bacterium]
MAKRFPRLVAIFILWSLVCLGSAAAAPAEDRLAGIDQFIAQVMGDWQVPGLAVAVVKDGQIIFTQGFGVSQVKTGQKVTPDTIFGIGSCTKAFTATVLGTLVDQGKLNWDTPARDYIPFFKMYDEYVTAHLTLRDMLTHRTGLARYDSLLSDIPQTRKEIVDRLQYLEPNKGFRSAFEYSNIMYVVAGFLAEQVSGQTWEDLVRARILTPLNMKSTNFSPDEMQKAPDFALPYREEKGVVKQIPFAQIKAAGPAGSINSNVRDMANWLQAWLNKGQLNDKKIITEKTWQDILTPQVIASGRVEFDEKSFSAYALGWMVTTYQGRLMVTHEGEIDGFHSSVSFLPRDNIGVVVLVNKSDSCPVPGMVVYNAYDRLLGLPAAPWNQRIKQIFAFKKEAEAKQKAEKKRNRKTGTKPSHPLDAYGGTYGHPAYGFITVTPEGDRLKVTTGDKSTFLTHYHYDVFETAEEPPELAGLRLTFITGPAGDIASVSAPLEHGVKDIVLTRMTDKK